MIYDFWYFNLLIANVTIENHSQVQFQNYCDPTSYFYQTG